MWFNASLGSSRSSRSSVVRNTQKSNWCLVLNQTNTHCFNKQICLFPSWREKLIYFDFTPHSASTLKLVILLSSWRCAACHLQLFINSTVVVCSCSITFTVVTNILFPMASSQKTSKLWLFFHIFDMLRRTHGKLTGI